MHITNFNELDLTGADGEDITITVSKSTGSPLVTYNLNGSAFAGGTFKLDRTVAPVFKLLVVTTYKGTSGGSSESQVIGNPAEETSIHDEVQAPGEAFDGAMYRIVIV